MNKDTKDKWLTALRSGDYIQGNGALRKIDPEGPDRFCCLGVLCDLFDPHGWGMDEAQGNGYTEIPYYDTEGHWDTGMPSDGFLRGAGLSKQLAGDLAEMNDDGHDFEEIAQRIENDV